MTQRDQDSRSEPPKEHPFVAQLYEKTTPSPPIFRRFVGDRELLQQRRQVVGGRAERRVRYVRAVQCAALRLDLLAEADQEGRQFPVGRVQAGSGDFLQAGETRAMRPVWLRTPVV